MVTPGSQLEFARQVRTIGGEDALRAATSRAYYAAFWHCRALVESRIGPLDESGSIVHRRVAESLALLDPASADRLSEMRAMRNFADYEPGSRFPDLNVDLCLELGAELLKLS